MEMMGKIRRMYFCDKLSLHKIIKCIDLSRNTIRKWIRAPQATQPVYQRHAIFKTECFSRAAGAGAVGTNQGLGLWRWLRSAHRVFPCLARGVGEAFQFDWSEEGLLIGSIYRRMQVAHLKLCSSRAFWLAACPSQGHEMLFYAHTRSFSPCRGIGNMKTAVDKVNEGKGRTVMCAHYLFDPDFCNVASGWEKGIAEKNVQDSRRRIWLVAKDGQPHSFEELNAWLGQRCRALWSELPHPQYSKLSVAGHRQDAPGHCAGCVRHHPARQTRALLSHG